MAHLGRLLEAALERRRIDNSESGRAPIIRVSGEAGGNGRLSSCTHGGEHRTWFQNSRLSSTHFENNLELDMSYQLVTKPIDLLALVESTCTGRKDRLSVRVIQTRLRL